MRSLQIELRCLAAALGLAVMSTVQCPAQAGSLDPTFGNGGKVTTDFRGHVASEAHAVAIQADSKVVVIGWKENPREFALARYNPDGTLDSSFGTAGQVITHFGDHNGLSAALAGAVQGDGKIVAAGYYHRSGNSVFALARYLADGSLDTSFGTDGKVATEFQNCIANALAIQGDGKILIAGRAYTTSEGNSFTLLRYDTDGSLDASFGSSGRVTTLFGSSADRSEANAVALQSDGKIVTAGYWRTSTGFEYFALTRHNADGSLDPSFDNDGKATLQFPNSYGNMAYALGIDGNGRIVAGGTGSPNGYNRDFALARFNTNGTLDTSFGNGGRVTTAFDVDGWEAVRSLAIQGDGTMVAAGHVEIGSSKTFGLARYNVNGSLDTSFDNDGMVTTSFAVEAYAHAAAVRSGKIVTVGQQSTSAPDFAIACYNTNGSLDANFGSGGKVTTQFLGSRADQAQGVATVQADGSIVVAGTSTGLDTGWDMAIARYTSSGSLDEHFGTAGMTRTHIGGNDLAYALAIQTDKKIVVAGSATSEIGGIADFVIARYSTDGTLDSSFGVGGKLTTRSGGDAGASTVGIQSDGKIIAAGSTRVIGGSVFCLCRYNGDGSLDGNFGTGGKVTTDILGQAFGLVIQRDGRIVVAGWTYNGTAAGYGLARYNHDGSPDNTFGTVGKVTTYFGAGRAPYMRAVAIQRDGKIVVVGYEANRYCVLARYNTDGCLDSAFGADGKVTTDFGWGSFYVASSVAIQPDRKILVAGKANNANGGQEFSLARYNPDGSLDGSFGTAGKVTTNFGEGGSSMDIAYGMALHAGKIILAGLTNSTGGADFALARYEGYSEIDAVAPIAVPGPDQAIHAGSTVHLDGSYSFDETSSSSALEFEWQFVARPSASTAVLVGAQTATPSFYADQAGTYEIQLVVTDEGDNPSDPKVVVVSSLNLAPNANAGVAQLVIVQEPATLDGRDSSDPDQDPITWAWTLVGKPFGSTAALAGAATSTPTLTPDLIGTYVVELVVSDAFQSSPAATVTVVAISANDYAKRKLLASAEVVLAVPPASLDVVGHRNTLVNELAAITDFVDKNRALAIQHLTEMITRVDGWTLRGAFDPKGLGQPYAADFVVEPIAQREMYALLTAALAALST